MINTIETKEAQLRQGYYQSGTGPEEILIIGSCRTVPYLSYLAKWNNTIGNNRFTVRRIDPCDWVFDGINLDQFESNELILSAIENCDIFIHEHLVSYGMFNTDQNAEKNIWQFGMEAYTTFLVPNFHDHLILENDWVDYGSTTPDDYIERGEAEVEKFCKVAEMSSFPSFADYFRNEWRKIRFFWRPNHVSAQFTMGIFGQIAAELFLFRSDEFFLETLQWDLFRDPHTQVTQRDVDGYKLEWR